MEQETTDNPADSPDHSQDDPLLSQFIDKTGMNSRKSGRAVCFFCVCYPFRRYQLR